jgi:hypothetical protein
MMHVLLGLGADWHGVYPPAVPVPAPHGWGGIMGLIGMFAGGIIGGKLVEIFISRAG